MSTQLERELIKELVRRVTYEELTNENLEEIKKIVEELEKSDYKQAIKNEILKCLGVDTSKYRVTASISTIVDRLIYLRRGVGIKDIRKVLKKFLNVLYLTAENIQRKVEYLQSIGLEKEDIGELVECFPNLLGLSLKNLQEKVEYLQSIGVKDIKKAVKKFPYTLAYSVNKIRRVVNYLKKIGVKNVGKVIENYPPILGYSRKRLKKIVEYLQSIGIENVGKVVERYPHIFGFSIHKMQKIVKYLERVGIRNVSEVIEKNPSIFGLSEETIEGKYKYLVEEVGLRAEDIEKYTILLTSSLENRIIPRLERLKSLEIYGIYLERDKITFYLVWNKNTFERVTKSYIRRMKLQIERDVSKKLRNVYPTLSLVKKVNK